MLRVEGPNPCSSWVTQGAFPLHNFPLYNALSPTVHLNGSNGTAYTRPSMVQNTTKMEVPLFRCSAFFGLFLKICQGEGIIK